MNTPVRQAGCTHEESFDPALRGDKTFLELDDGRTVRLSAGRWSRSACRGDRWLLDRCWGTTVDLGCGPGRLVAALVERGLPVLGVDVSALAVRHTRDRGAPVVQADLFTTLPREGEWATALLADGNLGIGGDPLRLLRRARTLVRAGGQVLVEPTASWSGHWQGQARLGDHDGSPGGWFPWSVLGLDALGSLAAPAGLRLVETHRGRRRQFARFVRTAEEPRPS
ncbi:class I SAM-dependent methyltransferase [Amycolatopsis sp. NBC_01286]|uniref:class I SAM-dependent methyltransferase n=1 Tax=Amycolatopsis sp. NBC_01286 TaxID=2903560 RepID=UPI002E149C46|nr:class I SAM-dependent methyltransferase [Amycolatopsis sp. NBC_01286]